MKTTDTTHNGWTNYATWKVMLEIFHTYTLEEGEPPMTADCVEGMAEEIIFLSQENEGSLMESYARGFLADVNWYEIAEAINETAHE